MVYVSFLPAVALAGLAFLLGTVIVRRVSLFRKYFVPASAIGGLIVDIIILVLRLAGLDILLPLSGYDVVSRSSLRTRCFSPFPGSGGPTCRRSSWPTCSRLPSGWSGKRRCPNRNVSYG